MYVHFQNTMHWYSYLQECDMFAAAPSGFCVWQLFLFFFFWGWSSYSLRTSNLCNWRTFECTWKLQDPVLNECQIFYYIFIKILDCILTVISNIIFARWLFANNSLFHPICQTATTQQVARVNACYDGKNKCYIYKIHF